MMIILPSSFSGAAMCFLSKSQLDSISFFPAMSSESSYQAVAWYMDTKFHCTPVMSGCFVALVYTIHHREVGQNSIPGLIPSASLLGTTKCFEARLMQVLKKWKQQLNQKSVGSPSATVSQQEGKYNGTSNKEGGHGVSQEELFEFDVPTKMIFGYKTRAGRDNFPRLLVDVARRAHFGSAYAHLRYEEARYAAPLPDMKRPGRGYYESWELEIDEGCLDEPEGGLLEIDCFDWKTRVNGGEKAEILERGLDDYDWAVDNVTEMAGNVFHEGLQLGSSEVDVDWDGVDFEEGEGRVVLRKLPATILSIFMEAQFEQVT